MSSTPVSWAFAAAVAATLGNNTPSEPAANHANPLARSLDGIQVTANRRPEALSKAPRAVSTVRPRPAGSDHTIAESLRGVPGVFVQQTTPGQANAIVRGLKGSEVLHLVDGTRMNMALFRNAPNNYVGLVDPLAVERIEVLRGTGSVLYGSDAMGGVVHVLTEGPDLRTAAGTRYRLQGGIASGDLSTVARASASTTGHVGAAHAALFQQDVGLRRTADGQRQPFSGFTARGAELGAATRLPGWDAQLRFSHYQQPSTPRHDALVAGFGQDVPDSLVSVFEPNRRDAAALRFSSQAGGSFFDDAELLLGWQTVIDGRRVRDTGSTETVVESNASRMLSGSAVFSRAIQGDGILTFGADGYFDRVASTRTSSVNRQLPEPRVPRFADQSRLHALGIFANQEWFPREGTELVLGARYSRVWIDLPPSGEAPGARLEPHDFSGSIGLSQMLRVDLQLLANVGRGFRAPNVFDLGNLGPRPGNRYNQPNPTLRPERVLTADLGLRLGSGPTNAEVFVFASWYEDRIASVATGEYTADGAEIVESRNLASARFRGIEAALQHALTGDTLLHAALNATWGEARPGDGTRQPADRVPPLNGTLALRHRLAPEWTLDLRAWAAAEQHRLGTLDRGDPRIHPEGTPGFAAFGMSATRTFDESGTVVLRVDNLFDRSYREHGSGIDATGISLGVAFDWRF